ncbi:hypothetical protein M1523_02320 [Patescibacteria group bacterium]|nr:hypothetical protein [Patescibacteria group bacterium]MCL5091444.1 hypothetical protein [Patescibacteria group bacterium]
MRHAFDYIKKHPGLLFLIVPAFILYMSVTVPSGSQYCYQGKCGIYFWGVHGHDAVWHLALVETAFNRFPFISPVFSGAALNGYNYLFDLVIYLLVRFTHLSALTYFFKIIPVVWFILFTALAIQLSRKLKDRVVFTAFFLFFLYFSSSFSYIFTLIHDQTVFGSAGLLSQQIYHIMFNPQYALSLLGMLYLLIKFKENRLTKKTVFAIAVVIFLNFGLKFYGGFAALVLGMLYCLLEILPRNRSRFFILSGLMLAAASGALMVFYAPFSAGAGGAIFSLAPFALVHPITEDPGLLYLQNLTNARYFLLTRPVGPKLIVIEAINLVLFLFFYLGVRFFGLLYFGIRLIKKKLDRFDAIVMGTMVVTTAMTVLFVQKAEWWNTIQFFYYAVFLSSIYLAELAFSWYKTKTKLALVGIIILIGLALPATVDIAKSSWSLFPGGTYIPKEEIEALAFLKSQPVGVVFSPLFDDGLVNQYAVPRPLFANGDTAYVSAFSGKPSYFADLVQIRLTGIDYQARLDKIERHDCRMLEAIDYVYYNNDHKIDRRLFDCPSRLVFLWGNRQATIYRVVHPHP